MEEALIAPCGMNCAVCSAHLAYVHNIKSRGVKLPYCTGCRARDKQCAFLKKKCQLLPGGKVKYCYQCSGFPCEPLRHLDRRYRTLFRMSMIANLERIKTDGIQQFLRLEEAKWKCPDCGEIICCHNGICYNCGQGKLKDKANKFRWEDNG